VNKNETSIIFSIKTNIKSIAFMKIQHTGQGQIFQNPILEKLTRTHAAVPITIFYLTALSLMVYSFVLAHISTTYLVIFFLAGLFFWTFFEYIGHRFAFHIPTTTQAREKFQYTFHGVHHEYPRDKQRLAMPPAASVVIVAIIIFLFRIVFGMPGYAIVAGFLAGYATYLLIHFSIHTRVPPKNFLGKLWMHHSIHHYKDQKVAFGVSSPLWDMVFGTMPGVKPQISQSTARRST
jgi:sterol desaturase/sphingolipid hydroxylase (fatty acid hydroxylase superfamily)